MFIDDKILRSMPTIFLYTLSKLGKLGYTIIPNMALQHTAMQCSGLHIWLCSMCVLNKTICKHNSVTVHLCTQESTTLYYTK